MRIEDGEERARVSRLRVAWAPRVRCSACSSCRTSTTRLRLLCTSLRPQSTCRTTPRRDNHPASATRDRVEAAGMLFCVVAPESRLVLAATTTTSRSQGPITVGLAVSPGLSQTSPLSISRLTVFSWSPSAACLGSAMSVLLSLRSRNAISQPPQHLGHSFNSYNLADSRTPAIVVSPSYHREEAILQVQPSQSHQGDVSIVCTPDEEVRSAMTSPSTELANLIAAHVGLHSQ